MSEAEPMLAILRQAANPEALPPWNAWSAKVPTGPLSCQRARLRVRNHLSERSRCSILIPLASGCSTCRGTCWCPAAVACSTQCLAEEPCAPMPTNCAFAPRLRGDPGRDGRGYLHVSPRVRRSRHNPHELSLPNDYRQISGVPASTCPRTRSKAVRESALDAVELAAGQKAILSLQLPAPVHHLSSSR